MGEHEYVCDISINQSVKIEKDYTYVVVPTSVMFLNEIVVESSKKIPNFIFKPTLPFDYTVPRSLRIAVTKYEKVDEYCSKLSEDLDVESLEKSKNALNYSENDIKYYKKLEINENSMKNLWTLLRNSNYRNMLLDKLIDSTITETEKEYIEANVLMTTIFDYMTIVFENPITEDQEIVINYNGKNIKKEIVT